MCRLPRTAPTVGPIDDSDVIHPGQAGVVAVVEIRRLTAGAVGTSQRTGVSGRTHTMELERTFQAPAQAKVLVTAYDPGEINED